MPSEPPAATPLPFAGLALERAAELREDAESLAALWPRARLLFVDFEGRATLSPAGDRLAEIAAGEFAEQIVDGASFLGLADDQPWFALPAERAGVSADDPRWRWSGLRESAARLGAFDAGLFSYAKALLLWQTRARFCGACGARTELQRAGHATRCSADDCGLEHFPRTDAAIIVLVTDGDRALLGRQAGWPAKRYSTLAGFVEPGESLEDALRREVAEESGVRVGDCSYRQSQPWPFPASLMVGFRATALDPTIRIGDELEDAFWIGADALLDAIEADRLRMPMPISVSFRLIADWLLETADPVRVRALLPGA